MRSIVLYIILTAYIIASCHRRSQKVSEDTTAVLEAPARIAAGEELALHIQKKSAGACYLICNGTSGVRVIALNAPVDTILVMREKVSGWMELRLASGDRLLASHNVFIVPQVTTDLPDAYMGPKAIVAGRSNTALLTALPGDIFSNMLPDGTAILFSLLYPDNTRTSICRRVRNGIAFYEIRPGKKAGKIFAYTQAGNRTSEEKQLLVVAGAPTSFNIHPGVYSRQADGVQTFTVYTDMLKDKNGNTIPDGCHVIFDCLDADRTTRNIDAYTISGVAKTVLRNPSVPGPLMIKATVNSGGSSPPLVLVFNKIRP
ncbi:MAG: hypothetical protein J0H74_24385 [Chitinophagaceae bacterium]|nr:hypothetical protein [Chitinophagaceae bacterium]